MKREMHKLERKENVLTKEKQRIHTFQSNSTALQQTNAYSIKYQSESVALNLFPFFTVKLMNEKHAWSEIGKQWEIINLSVSSSRWSRGCHELVYTCGIGGCELYLLPYYRCRLSSLQRLGYSSDCMIFIWLCFYQCFSVRNWFTPLYRQISHLHGNGKWLSFMCGCRLCTFSTRYRRHKSRYTRFPLLWQWWRTQISVLQLRVGRSKWSVSLKSHWTRWLHPIWDGRLSQGSHLKSKNKEHCKSQIMCYCVPNNGLRFL